MPLATTVPFLFLRKEGLSKCGRCKQAFYCNVECQVGAGPPGREGLVSSEDPDPNVLLFLVVAFPSALLQPELESLVVA